MSGPPSRQGATIHARIAAQAALTPNSPALVTDRETLTYGELVRRARLLAHFLRGQGARLEEPIGVCLERSADLVVCLLAVLEAGATYLPLDPNYPRERIGFMLEDAQARLLLTRRELESKTSGHGASSKLEPIFLEELPQASVETPGFEEFSSAQALSHLIYTSGSTGRPKGVAICHHNVTSFFDWAETLFPAEELRGVFAATSICFDLSIFELFFPLTRGGTVILGRDALHLPSHPARAQVTLVNTVPSAITELVRQNALPAGVITVNLAGEPLKRALTDAVYAAAGVQKVYNLYGPSEDTTYSTWVLVPKGSAEEPTIGVPIDGSVGYVLDGALAAVAEGEIGELYLGGLGVSRGYLGRPAQTAERYLPDPFSGEAGARFYRTGDRVRRRADGQLEFLGRVDHQVKIRGFRIELGEIEAALARHPAVEMPLALVREDQQDDPRIVAYFQQKAGLPEPNAQELRRHLAEFLPHFMVPSAFVALAKMPLTPNGKIDRNPLLAMVPPSLEEGPYKAPEGPLETALAGLFAEILGVGRVGRDDSFLELGGHSLLAARLAARIESELGRAIGQRTVFEAPSVAALAAALERGGGRAARGPIPPRDASQKGPLSAGQRGLFYLWQLDPSSPQYATPVALRLRGKLDVAALERSIARLIARHEALRCRFPLTAGVPEALVEDAQTSATAFHLEAVDLRQEPEPFARALAAAQEASKQGFDLEKESSFRVKLWRTGEAEHLLFVNLHHIVTDGVSLEIFFDELGQLYAGECRGEVAHLPTLEAGLLDTVAYLEAEAAAGTENNLAFWQERLQGIRSIELPSDHPRPATPRHRGDAFRWPLAGHLVAALSEVGRPHGATFFLVATAAFHAWLTRLTGQSDAVLGVPIAGRNHPATRRQLGLFINALPVRVDAGGDPSFLELLARVRQRHLEAWTHEAMPMDRLVAELAPNRQLGRNPFFDLAFQVRDGYFGSDVLPGLAAEHLLVHNGTSKFDLDIALVRRGNELMVEVEYDLELFESATIESFLSSFLALLEDVSRRPEARLSALAMVPAAQLAQLSAWNATGGKAPVELSLAELFRRAAAKNPTAKALEYRDETLSYEQLDRLSDALAQRLIAAGVLPGDLVALAGERSARQIAALLAIVKAGAAYVPLDAGYPRERLSFLLEDARPKVLLAEEGLLGKLPLEAFEAGGGRTLLLDEKIDGSAGSKAGTSLPTIQVDGSFPAYVIYTSGSTGQPKGVVVPQRAVVRLVFDNRFFELGPQERIAQASNISFDAATFEIWGALLHGGCLVGVERDTLLTADKLRAFLREERISAMWLTASLFHQYARQMPDVVASLGTLLFGGERCDPEAVRKALELGPKRLINGYGPTETTTFAATYEVHEVPAGAVSVPIGRPIGETELWIVDRWGEPLPIGATGELWIGGAGLAHAYLGRPSLTARSFVPHPSSQTPGARLYRSGDLVRLRPDGLFDYVGRIDQQVKVRGFRVELGEIEALLGRHPAVAERAVALQDDGRGSGRLVAYVVLHAGEETSADALRAFLGQTLPDYLVPTAFQFLPQLPLTAHGKVDRRALPAFDFEKTGAQAAAKVQRPQSEIEKRVHAAWCELFGVEAIDLDAQFFSIGGHSLLAAQLLARLHQQFQLELPLRVIYEHPSISDMARLIEKRLLEKLLLPAAAPAAEKAGKGSTAPVAARPVHAAREEAILPLPPGTPAPLSYGQRRLFFLHLLEPEASIYNLGFALELRGPLDRRALEQTLEEIARRHAILRTRYLSGTEGSSLVVDPPSPFRFKVEDLRSLDPAEQQRRLQQELDHEIRRGFDLQQEAVWRARLLQLGEDRHAFLFTLHHIATDGWSQGILSREIAELYDAFRQGKPSPLPEPSLQYQDFAAWQEGRFRRRETQELFEFWRRHLEGIEPTELASDFPRPAEQSYRGDSFDLPWPQDLMPKVRRFSQKQGTSTFVTCLSAFFVTLQAFCDRDDLAVGTVVGGRERNELEEIVGFFINTLILRTRIEGDPTFAAVVAQTRATFLEAHEHSELPFDQLVESLLPSRDLSRHPFVSILFQIFDRELTPQIPGLTTRELEPQLDSAKMDLVVTVLRRGNAYSFEVEFAADLYRRPTVEQFFHSYLVLLAVAIDTPSARLSELPLLGAAQKALWRQVNPVTDAAPLGQSLFELFEAEVAADPQRPAIESAGRKLSYGQLAALAHAIALRLAAEGARPGDVVGLGLERSIELIAAILAVAEIGATYAPLDPNYPAQRLGFMIEDTAMRLLLTRAQHFGTFEGAGLAACGGRCIDIETITPEPGPASGLATSLRDTPAMIIYTSGSTGQPKGVVVPQAGVLRLVRDNRFFEILPSDVFAHASNPSFDAATFEIWGALLNGASLVVIDTETLLAAEKLRAEIGRSKISVLFLTTALFQQFSNQLDHAFEGLRAVFFGGERCDTSQVRHALAKSGAKALFNAYGPTEDTTFATTFAIDEVPDGAGSVPIGQPIAGTEACIVDRRGRFLPPGAVGELLIGGRALAHGYLNRPGLTARAFIPHPSSAEPGARLYRSGDLVRLDVDGRLDYLGRVDHQVKLRGFRIELGEIENALARHPEVRGAAVVLSLDERGEQHLAAYFEPAASPPPSAAALREFLELSLPAYFLPTFYSPLDELPLTPNGKVDRKKLEKLELTGSSTGAQERIAPRDETEEAVHDLWCELFKLPQASVEDNFFLSGGHSLLAAQLLARVRDRFGVDVPLRLFFRKPTLAGLAAALKSIPQATAEDAVPTLPKGSLPTFSFGQKRLFFLYQLDPDSPSYNIPLAIELRGDLDVRALERAVETLIQRHEVLRTRYLETDEGPRLALDAPASFQLEIENLEVLSPEIKATALNTRVGEEMQRPFRLEAESVLRARLLRLGPDHHVFQLTLHHIASDGLSQQIVAQELASLYGAYQRGEENPLARLAHQYSDYAAWMENLLQGERYARLIAFWREQLAGLPALELPTDFARPEKQSLRGAPLTLTLAAESAERVRRFARNRGETLFTVLLAALAGTLSRLSGQNDFGIGTVVAGRPLTELESLVGFFVNTLVLRQRLAPNATFEEILVQARETFFDAEAHQLVPFEKLVEELRPKRDTSRPPFVQVVFQVVGMEMLPALPGLASSLIDHHSGTSKFDLAITAQGQDAADELVFAIEYDTALFAESSVKALFESFETFLLAATQEPTRAYRRLPIYADPQQARSDFWRLELAELESTELPLDAKRQIEAAQHVGRQRHDLPADLPAAVAALAERLDGTSLDLYLAALFATLEAYCNRSELALGVYAEDGQALALRVELKGDPSFTELALAVHRELAETRRHAFDSPALLLAEVLAEVQPSSAPTDPPLIAILFAVAGEEAPKVRFEELSRDSRLSLAITLFNEGGPSRLEAAYAAELFLPATIDHFLRSFAVLLTAATSAPAKRLSELPLLDLDQRQLWRRLNTTSSASPIGKRLFEVFAEQVARRRDQVAIEHNEETLTYGELAERAHNLALHLVAKGAQPGDIVAISLERSAWLITCLLGVLEIGATYNLLDPVYPEDRLAFMLEDTATRFLLTSSALATRLPTLGLRARGGQVLEVDRLEAAAEIPLPQASHLTPATLIYTSGSTGRPKGVLVPQAGILRLVIDNGVMVIEENDHVSQLASPSFDASSFEIWGALLNGARLVVVDAEFLPVAEELRRILEEKAVTVVLMVTALFQQFALEAEGGFSGVRMVGFGGEKCDPATLSRALAANPQTAFFNVYGPTEDATFATVARIEEISPEAGTLPIGEPISFTDVYLTDHRQRLLPPGAVGELWIGGPALAHGYLRRPALTARSFIPHPFSEEAGARLYRSGDLVRFRPQGDFDFIGRIDHQVKLRGFRIELGEIEAVLARHQAIGQTLVMVREDIPGDPRLCAYFTWRGLKPQTAELRDFLRRELPRFMVPAFFVGLDEMPLTPNGKIDRKRLPAPQDESKEASGGGDANTAGALEGLAPTYDLQALDDLEDVLKGHWRSLLQVAEVGLDDNFFDLGGHSLLMPQLLKKLAARFPQLRLLDLFRFPTVRKLAEHLRGGQVREGAAPARGQKASSIPPSSDIAIIGLAGRFPRAANAEELWQNVLDGVEALTPFSEAEMLASGVDGETLAQPDYVRAGTVLEGIEFFDADFFAMNAREAQITDPQHRLFLETAWEAVERAGWAGEGQDFGSGGRVGVFAGTSMSGYFLHHVLSHPDLAVELGALPLQLGADKDFLATRVAYKLDLTGPAFAVQTACSTSLVAVHLACRSLRDGECDLALAGGATVQIPQKTGYAHVSGSILSPDGHCRAFDARAAGTIPSSGVGVVVLKRLDDAKRDGDHVVAVIRGSAINNDGAGKVGFTAPSVDGQARVISDALARAGVPARTVGYVECHGTGTQMGDPIEVAALEKVHRAESADRNYCAISSFKTQVGHMDSAAGVGGLIRAAMAVERAMIPPNLHFEQPNPELRLEQSPFYVPIAARSWEDQGTPRRAGVSSFGIGGTNAHVVLEEAPPAAPTTAGRPHQLLLLSARSETSLLAHAEAVAKHLEVRPELHSAERLADVASTLHRGRRHFSHRLALVVQGGEEAAALLHQPAAAWRGQAGGEAPPVAFLFPGQGAQYAGMGRDLYGGEPIFRQEIDACASRLEPLLGLDLRSLLFARGEQHESAQQRLQNTALAQPALFVVEWALAQLWLSWGITPTGLIGHSIGEYVAATLAGVFERDAALELVAARGRRMQELPPGKMLAVRLPESAVYGKLIASGVAEEVTFAAINGPHDVVVSGRPAAIDTFAATLARAEIETRELKTSHAFHSPMMDGVLDAFRRDVEKAAPQKPRRAFLSNLTGAPIDADLAVSPEYWARHLRHAVRFADGLAHLLADPRQILLEVGPGRTLGTLARRAAGPERAILASLPHPQDERSEHEILLESVARLYTLGLGTSGEAFYAGQKRRRLPLPTTPFERRRFWLEARPPQAFAPAATSEQTATDAVPAMPELAPVQQAPVQKAPNLVADPVAETLASPALAAAEPQDEVARQIEELWRNLLGAEEEIPFDLDFYEAGGDSLMATQLANRLRKLFGVVVRGNELMADALTIAEQADLLRERLNEKD